MSDENEPVNIGNPAEMTIREFAEVINELTGNPAGIRFEPLPVDDPKQRQPDITKARAHPGLGAEGRSAHGDDADGGVVQESARLVGIGLLSHASDSMARTLALHCRTGGKCHSSSYRRFEHIALPSCPLKHALGYNPLL